MKPFTPAAKSPVPYHVLLVDDEPGVLQMFKTALDNYGFWTELATNGREGLEKLQNGSFDVVVSDVHMPEHGGLDFLRAVRERGLDVPVILMTGKPFPDTTNSALRCGAFRCLTKPVMPTTLRETIERAVRIHGVARLERR